MPDFSQNSKFNKYANFSSIKFGADAPLLETELNEMQDIQRERLRSFLKVHVGDGLYGVGTINYSDGIFTIENELALVNGNLITISRLEIGAVEGDSIYLQVKEKEVTYTDVLKKYGNEQETSTVPNHMYDERVKQETTRRVVETYTLSLTTDDEDSYYLKLGTITGGVFVNEVKSIKTGSIVEADFADLKGYIGYTENDIVGVEADFVNKKFTRLAGAINKTPGADFNSINAFGGRKRCILTDDGVVLAYYGEPGYVETGKLTQAITKNAVTYPVGTPVQVMVEQPKFYYKVVPLEIELIVDYAEVNTFKITAGCSTSGDLTITLNSVSFTVAVTAGDDINTVASKIRNATFSGWTTSGSGDSVIFTCNETGAKTTGTFNGGSTGVTATVTKTVAGGKSKGYHMRKARYYVSDTPKVGFKVHPAFVRNGVEVDKIYLSAYEGSIYDESAGTYLLADEQIADFNADKLSSIAYAKPASGLEQTLTRANTRKLANNRGNGWQISDVLSVSVTQILFIIEYASFNTQANIGLGVVNKAEGKGNESEITGATSNLGNASGMADGTNGLTSVSYRGEENPWGNIWKWMDGLNIEAKGIHQAYWADSGFADNIKTSPYKNCGFTLAKANGYVSAFGYSEDCDFLFLPSEVIGASNLPVGDSFYQNHNYNGFLVALLGGSWSYGSNAGAFYWLVYNASSSHNWLIGGRLLYVPQ